MFLDRSITAPERPLPTDCFAKGIRQTVVVCLCNHENGLAVIQPVRDPSRKVWILPQGPLDHNRSVFDAARQVLRDEIPSIRRDHPHASPYVDWKHAYYAGAALNLITRSGRPKHMHVVLLRTLEPKPRLLLVNEEVGRDACWVEYPLLEQMLLPTRVINPRKADITVAAALQAKQLGWLH